MDITKLGYPDSLKNIIDISGRFSALQPLKNLQQHSITSTASKVLELSKIEPAWLETINAAQRSYAMRPEIKIALEQLRQPTALTELARSFQSTSLWNSEVQKAMKSALSASEALPRLNINDLTSPATQQHIEQFRAISEGFNSINKNLYPSELHNITEQIKKLFPALSAIESLQNFPLDYVGYYDEDDYEDEFPNSDDVVEASEEVIEVISAETDFNLLTEPAKKYLLWFLSNVVVPLFVSLVAAWIYKNIETAQEELKEASTSEIKAITSGRAQAKFDRKYLKNHRVIISDFLNLRQEPSMKGEVITKLAKGTLVEVVDDPEYFNRSWLLVSVDVDGETETGWISRRYAIYFKLI